MNLTHKIKSSTVTLLLLSSMMLSAQASGDGTCHGDCKCPKRTYLRVDVGGSVLEYGKLAQKSYGKRFDPSVVAAIGGGYEINNRVRVDFTVSNRFKYYYKIANKQSLSSTALMINGYFNVIEATLTPYLMGGLGAAVNRASDYVYPSGNLLTGKTVTTFAWQTGAGLIYKLHDSVHIDLGYRYVSANTAKTSDIKVDTDDSAFLVLDIMEARMKSHECTIGLVYKF